MYRITSTTTALQHIGHIMLSAGQTVDVPALDDVIEAAIAAGLVTVQDLEQNTSTVGSGSFTRPANTTAYASGEIVSQSATAGSCSAIALAVGRTKGTGGRIVGLRLSKSNNVVTNASFRIHLFRNNPTYANGDAGTMAGGINGIASVGIGYFDVTVDQSYSDGAKGYLYVSGQPMFQFASGSTTLYAVVEARGAYTPASGETFTVELEVIPD